MPIKFTFKSVRGQDIAHGVLKGASETICGLTLKGLVAAKKDSPICVTCYEYLHKRRVNITKLPALVRKILIEEAARNAGIKHETN